MSWRLGVTTCSSTGNMGSVGWYSLGGEKDAGYLSFCISIDASRVSWCFRSLHIVDILWSMIQDSLGQPCEARVLPKIYSFTNPIPLHFFWYSCSSSILFTRLITSQQYLMEYFGMMLLSHHWYLKALTQCCNWSARPWQSKGRTCPPLISAVASNNYYSSSFM